LEFEGTAGAERFGWAFERRRPCRSAESWPMASGLPEDVFRCGDVHVLVVSDCTGDPSFLSALLGEELPLLAYPFPVVITAGDGSGRAKIFWKNSDVPEVVSEEALQAESEQLMYCYSGSDALDEASKNQLDEIRFVQIERDSRLLRRGLRLIFLTGGSADTHRQVQILSPWVDATVIVDSIKHPSSNPAGGLIP